MARKPAPRGEASVDDLLSKDALTTKEAAQILKISHQSVWRKFVDGCLTGWKTSQNGDIRIDPKSVIEFAKKEQGRDLTPKKKK